MSLYFITGNKGKFGEVKTIIPTVEQIDIDLPEIQEVDPRTIITAKLHEAFTHHKGEFIVEDTSLYFDCIHGLPGPLIKWFLRTIGTDGLANLAQKLGNTNAMAKTIIGYTENKDNISFFEGDIAGQIVSPRGTNGFGWDPIFQPDGFTKTFAEMTREEKLQISMRRIATEKLKQFLESKKIIINN